MAFPAKELSRRACGEETVTDGSRVDLLVQTDDTCVVVENKIHAPDQPRQLERYHAYASQWPNYRVIYLTLHGDDPGEESLGGLHPDEVACKSYESDVVGWLDDCIKEVARVPQIREILAHYQALLRKLTGRSTGELVMDLKELLKDKQGDTYNFELAPKIAEAMTAFSVETEWKFWVALRESLLKPGARPWRLKRLETTEAAALGLKEVDEGIIGHAHGARNKNKWRYGWTFRIESVDDPERYRTDGSEVLLRIECGASGWGFYGLIAVRSTPKGQRLARAENERLFEDWGKRLSSVEDGWRADSESWVAWAFPDEDVPLQKGAGWLEPHALRRLVEDKAVSPLVDEVHSTLDGLEGVDEPPPG